jgi:hypothetical protein
MTCCICGAESKPGQLVTTNLGVMVAAECITLLGFVPEKRALVTSWFCVPCSRRLAAHVRTLAAAARQGSN